MTKLEEEKLKEEIKKIRISRYADLLKSLAILIGSIILFIAIQMPESLLNKKISNETISRERAKLVFEVINNNNDYEDVLLKLSAIEKAYPNKDNSWINEIKGVYLTRMEKSNNSIDSTYNAEISLLRVELNKLLDKKAMLQTRLVSEISGESGTGRVGYGAVAKELQYQIHILDEQIRKNQVEIDLLRAEIKNSKK